MSNNHGNVQLLNLVEVDLDAYIWWWWPVASLFCSPFNPDRPSRETLTSHNMPASQGVTMQAKAHLWHVGQQLRDAFKLLLVWHFPSYHGSEKGANTVVSVLSDSPWVERLTCLDSSADMTTWTETERGILGTFNAGSVHAPGQRCPILEGLYVYCDG